MTEQQIEIASIRFRDLGAVTRMTHENMTGADRQFTRLVSSPLGFWVSNVLLPINLLLAGSGFKAVYRGEMIGCAYLKLSKRCGYVFNVSVRRSYRRQSIGCLLMEHLESETRKNRRQWMALQVDDGNVAAESLYETLGYIAFHPCFYAGMAHDIKRLEANGDVGVERLSSYRGSRLFTRYLEVERVEGDAWASRIIGDLVSVPSPTGEFYRCLVANDEVGCILCERKEDSLKIKLVLRPDQWGNRVAREVIASTLDALGVIRSTIEVYLGSSQHHEAVAWLFADLGLEERVKSRILMLKRIVP